MSKKTTDEYSKTVAELHGFKKGDFVKVKDGIKDPDDDKITIGNWCGRITEIYDDGIADIKWDSITIRGMNIKNIRKYEKEHLG